MNEKIDIDNLVTLVESKIPKSLEQVENRMLILRYIQKCIQVKNWLHNYSNENKNIKILDFGCGEGHTVLILNEMGFDVYGLEIKQHEYWKNIGKNFKVYDGINLPYQSSFFDVMIIFGVLEHIGSYPRDVNKFDEYQQARINCLLALRRILKKKGMIFIYDFPNKYSPNEILNELLNSPHHHEKTDKQSLTQVKNMVKKSGYTMLKAGRMGVLPAYVGYMSSFLKNEVINKHYHFIGKLDMYVDKVFGGFLGQSNYIIAQNQ